MKNIEANKKCPGLSFLVAVLLILTPKLQAGEQALYSVPGFEEAAGVLAAEYRQAEPGTSLQVKILSSSERLQLEDGVILLAGKEGIEKFSGQEGFRIILGRNVMVPVINSANPMKDVILEHGISREQFLDIYTGEARTWGEVLGTKSEMNVNPYMPGPGFYADYLEEYLETEDVHGGVQVVDDPGMLAGRISGDPTALGFCSLACLKAMEKKGGMDGLALVPIDMDGNGRADSYEQIYKCCDDLNHGIYLGKYPRELYGRMYAMLREKPTEGVLHDFLVWAVGDGQEVLADHGILPLDRSEQLASLNRMENIVVPSEESTGNSEAGFGGGWFLIGLFFLLGTLLLLVITRPFGKKDESYEGPVAGIRGMEGQAYPAGYYFDRSHTWGYLEKDGQVRIGVNAFLRDACGPLTRIRIEKEGTKVKKGDKLITLVQDGKQLVLSSPVSGIVQEHNSELEDDISQFNNAPYGAGWVCMVRPLDWGTELKDFLMGEPVAAWMNKEMDRMKAFFSVGSPVLQDGGVVSKGVLKDLGPEAWEEFQTGFLNS